MIAMMGCPHEIAANAARATGKWQCGGQDGHDHGPMAAASAVRPMIMAARPVRR
jgi:hypothetical protein